MAGNRVNGGVQTLPPAVTRRCNGYRGFMHIGGFTQRDRCIDSRVIRRRSGRSTTTARMGYLKHSAFSHSPATGTEPRCIR